MELKSNLYSLNSKQWQEIQSFLMLSYCSTCASNVHYLCENESEERLSSEEKVMLFANYYHFRFIIIKLVIIGVSKASIKQRPIQFTQSTSDSTRSNLKTTHISIFSGFLFGPFVHFIELFTFRSIRKKWIHISIVDEVKPCSKYIKNI